MRKLVLISIYFLSAIATLIGLNYFFGDGSLSIIDIVSNKINEAKEIGQLSEEERGGLSQSQLMFRGDNIFLMFASILLSTCVGLFAMWLIGSEGDFDEYVPPSLYIVTIISLLLSFSFLITYFYSGWTEKDFSSFWGIFDILFFPIAGTFIGNLGTISLVLSIRADND